MDRDTIFLYVIAVIALCFGLINCIQFFLKGNKTAETVGTIIFPFYELLYHLSLLLSALQRLYSILYKIRRIEIMPHFPGWFVAICVLLPVSNVIYKTWKNNKKK